MSKPNRKVLAKNGRTMYYLDNKLTSKQKYEEWESGSVAVKEKTDEAACLFCGKEPSRTKFVNLKMVKLCEDHYQEKTTGEIAERMRNV